MPNSTRGRFSRRRFLKRTATVAAAASLPSFVPAGAIGQNGNVAPSERINIGSIGIGMMGQGHLRIFLQYPDAHVVAVCDVDTWRRDTAKRTVEETYAQSRPDGKYQGCHAYRDLRDLLARDDVDAVVIATGDRWHATASVLAAEAGKDIYCEKPMTLSIRESQAMVEATRRFGRVCQIGLQQRSTAEFIRACTLVREGRLGKLSHVYVAFPGTSSNVNLPPEPVPEGLDWDLWLGPSPWRPFHHRFHIYGRPPRVVPWDFCCDFGGGNLTSNAVHAFDVVQWALGMDESGPTEIIPPETGEVPSLTYKYPGDILLQVVPWHLDPAQHFVPEGWDVRTRLQAFGALYIGEEGWIHVGRGGYLKSFPADIVEQPVGSQEVWHPVNNHHQNWLAAIRNRSTPACDVAIGCRSTTVSHLGCLAHWTGRAVKWDPEKEEFVGDDEANRLRRRAMREPWRV